MTYFKDSRSLLYQLLDLDKRSTLLRCLKTGHLVRVAHNQWINFGFSPKTIDEAEA